MYLRGYTIMKVRVWPHAPFSNSSKYIMNSGPRCSTRIRLLGPSGCAVEIWCCH